MFFTTHLTTGITLFAVSINLCNNTLELATVVSYYSESSLLIESAHFLGKQYSCFLCFYCSIVSSTMIVKCFVLVVALGGVKATQVDDFDKSTTDRPFTLKTSAVLQLYGSSPAAAPAGAPGFAPINQALVDAGPASLTLVQRRQKLGQHSQVYIPQENQLSHVNCVNHHEIWL